MDRRSNRLSPEAYDEYGEWPLVVRAQGGHGSSMVATLHVDPHTDPSSVTIWFESLDLLGAEPDTAAKNRHRPGDVCGFQCLDVVSPEGGRPGPIFKPVVTTIYVGDV